MFFHVWNDLSVVGGYGADEPLRALRDFVTIAQTLAFPIVSYRFEGQGDHGGTCQQCEREPIRAG